MNSHTDKLIVTLFLSIPPDERASLLGQLHHMLDASTTPVFDITKLIPPGAENEVNWNDWLNGTFATFMAGLDNPKNMLMNLANSYIGQKYPKIREILGYSPATSSSAVTPSTDVTNSDLPALPAGQPAINDIQLDDDGAGYKDWCEVRSMESTIE